MHPILQQIEQNLVLVEKGSFMMGGETSEYYSPLNFLLKEKHDESPVYQVTFKRDFYIGKYPVTQRLWQTVMEDNPSHFIDKSRPVEQVSWDEIQVLLGKLNLLTQKKCRFRLPTEAEWEYAARGGKHQNGFKYAGSNKLKEVAWHGKNSHIETKPVGLKLPNALGLYDMSGNVWEWCEIKSHNSSKNTFSNTGEQPIRGGCWHNSKSFTCNVTHHATYESDDFFNNVIGFRLSRY